MDLPALGTKFVCFLNPNLVSQALHFQIAGRFASRFSSTIASSALAMRQTKRHLAVQSCGWLATPNQLIVSAAS